MATPIWKQTPETFRAGIIRCIKRDTGREDASVLVTRSQTDAQWADAVKRAIRTGKRITPETLDRLIAIVGPDEFVFRDPVTA